MFVRNSRPVWVRRMVGMLEDLDRGGYMVGDCWHQVVARTPDMNNQEREG